MTSANPLDSPTEPTATHQPWMKLAALILVLAALGLPVNDLFRYALIVVSTVLIVAGTIARRPAPWLGALAAVALCLLGQSLFAAPRIEEGHNVFLIDRPGGALAAGLPAEAFRSMATEFDARYPRERRCDPATDGCWRGQGFPDAPFAFSADGIYDHPAYSRRVSGIDFADPVWLRLGFINELRYNWNSRYSDIDRASRDRRFWATLHRWTLTMPWFVMYRFPAAFVGSALCWQGEVLWENAGEHFERIAHASMQCRTLAPDDVGRRIFGVAIAQSLKMHLAASASVRIRQLVEPGLAALGCAAVLGLLMRFRLRRLALPFSLIAITLLLAFGNDASFIGGVRPFDSGDDGLVYDGYARAMLRQLLAGDLAGALAGGEPVFFFTPGMRYLRVAEHLVFGESYLGYLSLVLLLPFLVFALFRRFLPLRWALALAAIFAAVPVGVLFGSSLVQYVNWAARGFADPAAYTLFLAGLVLLVGLEHFQEKACPGRDPGWGPVFRPKMRPRNRAGAHSVSGETECAPAGPPRDRLGKACGAGVLFALALFVRPNLAPAAGILLAGAGIAALWQRQYRRAVGLAAGFLPVLGIALHNWVYGGALVLFTSTARLAMLMPPSEYMAALMDLVHLNAAGEHAARAIGQIGDWLAGSSELVVMAPLNAAAIIVLARVAVWRRADPWLRLIAAATLVQHAVALLYLTAGRYHYLTWLLTLLVVAAWVHGEGIEMLRRRFPKFTERIAKHPASLAVARDLSRMAGLLDR